MAQEKRHFKRPAKRTGTPARKWAQNHPNSAAMFFGATPKVRHPWRYFRLFLWFLSAGILTTLGFFFDSVPFWLAYTPFLMALITRARWHRVALVGGHFTIVFTIAATGLVQLGFSGWLVALGFLLAMSTLSGFFAVFGVGLATVILLLIPYFPGNPLLIAGAVYPGSGLFGIVLLAGASLAIPVWRRSWMRLLAVCLTIGVPSLIVHSTQNGTQNDGLMNISRRGGPPQTAPLTANQPDAAGGASRFESLALRQVSDTDPNAGTGPIWRLLLALRDLPKGSLVITGENVITADDALGKRLLCRTARAAALELYVGVAHADGTGEIWRYSGKTCPTGTRVYRAVTGIPGLTGPVWPNPAKASLPINLPPALDDTGFLACFEAFTLHRWIAMGMGMGEFETIVVVSNDHWTDPLPVALLRSKVSTQFAQMFGIEVFHAGRDQNILVLKGNGTLAEEKTSEGG